ncbi:MAG: cell division protein ZapB [Desulfobacterales bacterium]
MDDNQVLEHFDEIENKIQKLIDVRKTLEVELQDQKDYIAQLEIELQEKIEAENKLIEERSFVRSKIDSLLTKLQDIQIPINSDSQKS